MRYVNLSIVLVFRLVSGKVKSRFPDYQSLVHAKLLLPTEMKRMIKAEDLTPHESTWAPILWALKLLERARTEKKIEVTFTKILSPYIFYSLSNYLFANQFKSKHELISLYLRIFITPIW